MSKLLERAVADQLMAHLELNNLQVKLQSAYRRAHSTETALLRILNDLLRMLGKGNNAILVLLDLSAAFDTIDHSLLLTRLHAEIGLSENVLQWFNSYLTSRSQKVLVGHCLSANTELLYGVPQGSVLGPLLFSLYTRPLASVIEQFSIGYHFFADDTELYSSLPIEKEAAMRAIEKMESCCLEVKKWMLINKLKLNDQKTEVLLCGPPQRRENVPAKSLLVGDSRIQFSDVVKTLGVVLDSGLSFSRQISAIVKTCFFHVRSLSKVRHCLTRRAANAMAVALVLSKLDYCNALLHGVNKGQLQRLQVAQNSAARVVSKTKMRDHITPVLRDLHWLPVSERIKHKLLSITYQCIDKSGPEYLSELISEYKPERDLRSSSQKLLKIPEKKDVLTKTYAERAFTFLSPTLWKPVPLSIKQSITKSSFKSRLKTHLFP